MIKNTKIDEITEIQIILWVGPHLIKIGLKGPNLTEINHKKTTNNLYEQKH